MKLIKSYLFSFLLYFLVLFIIYFSGCSNDPVTDPNNTLPTTLFSDDFRFFSSSKWNSSGIIHIDSNDGYPVPCLNTGNGSVTNSGTFSTSQDLTVNVAYKKSDTVSTNGVNIRMLDNGSQYILVSIFKDNINLYIPSQEFNQAFTFPVDTVFHTFTDKMTTDGTNKFYRDNVLFSTNSIPGTHLLSISLSSPNIVSRFDNAVITTP